MRKTIKLLAGGSPCTHWSIAQKNNRETEPSGIGWELFLNYVIAWRSGQFDHFLYENNKSMAKPIRNQIDIEFNRTYAENTNWELISSVEEDKGHTKRWIWRNKATGKTEYITRILINSALVSAQNRQRYYWTNIPGVEQPADRGILLKDVLESGFPYSRLSKEKGYCLDANYWKTPGSPETFLEKKHARASRTMIAEPVCVAQRGIYSDTMSRSKKTDGDIAQIYEAREDQKTNALTTVQKDNMIAEPINDINGKARTIKSQYAKTSIANLQYTASYGATMVVESWDGKTYPVYEVKNGLITIKDKQYPIKLPDGYYIIRKLTVSECRRLQTIPDWYVMPCSNTQNYKMLGNGWTIEVIKHILGQIPNLQDYDIEVLSMYDGMSCLNIALKELGCRVKRYVSYEIDKYCIQTTQANFPFVEQRGDAFAVRRSDWSY